MCHTHIWFYVRDTVVDKTEFLAFVEFMIYSIVYKYVVEFEVIVMPYEK